MVYSYDKSQQDALISQIIFGIEFYMFRAVSVYIIRSLALCTQQYTGHADCLLASSQHNLYVLLCVQC